MLFRASLARDLAGADLRGGALIYSLWPGYLDRDRTDLRQWAKDQGLGFHLVHSSGHAHPTDLKRMAEALQPRRLMPIHSAHPEEYEAIYPAVQRAGNGEWVDV
jgi:ribonuclease J